MAYMSNHTRDLENQAAHLQSIKEERLRNEKNLTIDQVKTFFGVDKKENLDPGRFDRAREKLREARKAVEARQLLETMGLF